MHNAQKKRMLRRTDTWWRPTYTRTEKVNTWPEAVIGELQIYVWQLMQNKGIYSLLSTLYSLPSTHEQSKWPFRIPIPTFANLHKPNSSLFYQTPFIPILKYSFLICIGLLCNPLLPLLSHIYSMTYHTLINFDFVNFFDSINLLTH